MGQGPGLGGGPEVRSDHPLLRTVELLEVLLLQLVHDLLNCVLGRYPLGFFQQVVQQPFIRLLRCLDVRRVQGLGVRVGQRGG